MKHQAQRIAVLALILAVASAAAPALAADGAKGTVNLNTASAVELERLPGIGPALAGRIVAHREKNGSFQKVEDLMLVRGIGEKSFERLRPYLAVSGATTLTEPVSMPRAPKAEKKSEG